VNDLFSLDGKVAVVTGGGRGIGLMIARGLLQAGAKVYVSSRKEVELAAAVEALSPLGPVSAVPADVGTAAGVQTLASALGEREDAINALFNNAGAAWGAPFDEFPEGFDKVFDVNIKGPFLLTRALVPMLRAASTIDDPARVIDTGSIDGIRPPRPGMDNFSYSASLVNAIAPGLFQSRMTKMILAAGPDEVGAHLPLGRIGRPDDMAGIAVFLASRASTYITGAVIPVDGGVSTLSR
jgi:NAD(P)-dependent dehydrogenase (short-subunit alcohol dehydrogenase family)